MKKKKQFDAPRERLMEKGVEALSMAELIAIILSTGGKNKTVTELAHTILESKEKLGITSLCELDLEDLMNFNGIGEAKAMRLIAALELGKRQSEISINIKKKIGNPEAIFHLFHEKLRYEKKENFYAVMLNTAKHVIAKERISIGGLACAYAHPREVFKSAIKKAASSVILVHNHPSGCVTPSDEDILITKRLVNAGRIIGIEVIDHIIIGNENYLSMKKDGYINPYDIM